MSSKANVWDWNNPKVYGNIQIAFLRILSCEHVRGLRYLCKSGLDPIHKRFFVILHSNYFFLRYKLVEKPSKS